MPPTLPCPRLVWDNPEALGFVLIKLSGTLGACGILTMSPALLLLARRDGGCYQWHCGDADADDDDLCGKRERGEWYCPAASGGDASPDDDEECAVAAACRVFGTSPSNVIPSIAVVANLLCAVAMPVVGAVVDYTSKRLATLRCMGAVFMFTNFVQIFLTAETWFAMTVIQASIGSVTFLAQVVCNAAYVPELSPDPADVPKLTGAAKAYEAAVVIPFIIVVLVGVSSFVGTVQTARVGQVLILLVGGPMMVKGCLKLGPRPALHALADGERLGFVGFAQVARTSLKLWREYRTLGAFFLGYMCWQAATSAIVSLASAYCLDQLRMDAASFGATVIIFLVFTVPGAWFSSACLARGWLTLKTSVACALATLSAAVVFTVLAAHEPEQASTFFAVMPILGFGQGWLYPAQRNVMYALIPGGCETEMQGFYEFLGAVLSWAPPLAFIQISDALGSMRFAMLSMALFWLLGMAVLLLLVDVGKGMRDVAATLHLRVQSPLSDHASGKPPPQERSSVVEVELAEGNTAAVMPAPQHPEAGNSTGQEGAANVAANAAAPAGADKGEAKDGGAPVAEA